MYGFKILCEISKVPFEISYKILNPYTAKYAFYEVLKIWRLMISYSYDIFSLNETGPWSLYLELDGEDMMTLWRENALRVMGPDGNCWSPMGFTRKGPVMRVFSLFFYDVSLNELLKTQLNGR